MPAARLAWVLAGVAAVALTFLLLPSGRAAAHAVLERSLPVQNQRLAGPPELVETWYSEPLERSLTSLEALDTQGSPVHVGATRFSDEDPRYAAIALPSSLGPGIYTVTYQNVSTVDGHQWSGSFSFVILNPDGSVPAGTAFMPGGRQGGRQGYLPGVGDSTLRWFGLLAAVTMVGAAAFYLLVARPATQFLAAYEARPVEGAAMAIAADLTLIAVSVLLLSVVGQLFLLADRLGGLEAVDNILFDTRTGELWLSRAGLALALLLLYLPARGSEAYRVDARASLLAGLALLGGLGLLMTYSLGSHADAVGGAFWAVGSDFVHFAATAAWVGALLQLPLVFWWTRGRLERPQRLLYLANVFDRFSWLAVISVALLIATGVFNGFVQLPTFESLWETAYGRVLMAKLALILPLLGVAGINAVFLKPSLVDAIDALHGENPTLGTAGQPEARLETRLRRLQWTLPRTVAVEFLLAAAVLASVGVLAQSTTTQGQLREEAGKPSGEFAISRESGDLDVELSIRPFGLGVGTYAVALKPKPGADLGEVLGVRLLAVFDDPNAAPSAGRSGTRQDLGPTAEPGVWTAEAALLTQPGDWRIETRIRRRGLDDSVVNFSVPQVGGFLARVDEPKGLFDLPFTYVDWNVVAGGAMVVLGVGAFLIWRKRPPSWQRSTGASVALASVFALIAGTSLIFGVRGGEGQVPGQSPVPATQESLAIGRAEFERNCRVCHGPDGRGGARGADLTQHVPYHNDGTLFLWISEGIPLNSDEKRMPSFKGQLSDDERWHLVNFLRNAFGSGEFTPVLPADRSASTDAAR